MLVCVQDTYQIQVVKSLPSGCCKLSWSPYNKVPLVLTTKGISRFGDSSLKLRLAPTEPSHGKKVFGFSATHLQCRQGPRGEHRLASLLPAPLAYISGAQSLNDPTVIQDGPNAHLHLLFCVWSQQDPKLSRSKMGWIGLLHPFFHILITAQSRDCSQLTSLPSQPSKTSRSRICFLCTACTKQGRHTAWGSMDQAGVPGLLCPSEMSPITLKNENQVDKQPSVTTTLRSLYSIISCVSVIINWEFAIKLRLNSCIALVSLVLAVSLQPGLLLSVVAWSCSYLRRREKLCLRPLKMLKTCTGMVHQAQIRAAFLHCSKALLLPFITRSTVGDLTGPGLARK